MRFCSKTVVVCASAASAVLLGAGACAPASSAQIAPVSPASSAVSRDATAEAQAVLRDFLKAWGARDLARYNSLVTTEKARTELTVERVVVETITAVPWSADGLPSGYNERLARAKPAPEYRVFYAPIRLWDDSTVLPGQELPWHWFLVRGSDGKWRVFDWGAG